MREELIRHLGRGRHAYILPTGEALITLEVAKNDAKRVYLVHYDKYLLGRKEEFLEAYSLMRYEGNGRFVDYYQIKVKPLRGRLHYFFKIEFNSGEVKYFNASGLTEEPMFDEFNIFAIPYLNLEDRIETPAWARDSVMYQIFPDTFNKPGGFTNSKEERADRRFSNGTLKGIKEKIPYLKELGIDVIYLTPIFKSNSNHRYDTVDYMEIDSRLGDKEDLRALVNELHKNNMKIVLDGVFNHTSSHFFAFEDIILNQEKSKYKDWYHIIKFPVVRDSNNPLGLSYESWSCCYDMPKLNTCNNEVIAYIFKVIEYWTKEFNIDGWRLDVANEVPIYFWRQFRELIKGINKDILLIGESWNDSSAYLDGTSFDSVMNYLFRTYVFRLMDGAKKSPKEEVLSFIESYSEHRMMYPRPHFEALINLISSHDVERLASIYSEKEIRVMLLMLLTLSGLPCIYYGDELALKDDPIYNNRAPMPWDKLDCMLIDIKPLIALRHQHSALRAWDISFIAKDAGVLEYVREDKEEKIGVLINFNSEEYKLKNNYDILYGANKASLEYLDFIIYKLK